MDISVKLFGGLRHFLPPGSGFNDCIIKLDEDSSLAELLEKVPVPNGKPYLAMLNDTKISLEDYAQTKIQPNDELVLLPPIKGG